ncbi:MAG: hypothetical protein M3464_03790 [Chloroflexota bacterium]|nr:hypothetical protein [Chloroflexota bacterium]
MLFAAAYSGTGAAHDLILAAIRGRLSLVLSDYVLAETERNLLKNAPRAHPAFLRFQATLPFQVSRPPKSLITRTMRVVVAKDAPIIAAAQAADVTLVATYDRKDLLSKRGKIFDAFGIIVATPQEILTSLDDPR